MQLLAGRRPSIRGEQLDPRSAYVFALGVSWALIQLYAGLRHVSILEIVHIHVMLALSMTFAVHPTSTSRLPRTARTAIDTAFTLVPLGILAYLLSENQRLLTRIAQVAEVTTVDMVLGTLTILLVLEAARRVTGLVLPLIGGLFLAYGYFGMYLPTPFFHSGIEHEGMIDIMFLDDRGIFGTPAKVSAQYVYLFVLFGAILVTSGAGENLLDLATAIAGNFRGGAAKIAVMASAVMASINGSAVANTVSTGSITIPLMAESGYDDESAGAIESLASTGGQLMPPVMGAAAFVLAELSGTPYIDLLTYVVIPSILFYVGVYTSVHLEALKQDVPAIPRDELPSIGAAARKTAHLVIPIVGLLYVLFETRNVELAAGVTVVLTFASVQLHGSTRMGLRKSVDACREGSEMVLAAALPCAIAGIIIGVVFFSGLGARLTSVILSLTGGSLLLTLLLVAAVSIVLGMGMPTTGAYITVAVLAVPTLIELGVEPLAAHLFGLYFAVFSMVTPPIAIAAFAASSISGGDPMDTGIKAFKMGVSTYAVPFLFVLYPALILQDGTMADTAYWTVVAFVVVIALSVVGTGYLFTTLSLSERVTIAAGAVVLLLAPNYAPVAVLLLIVGTVGQLNDRFGKRNSLLPDRIHDRL